jgi:acyl-CoA thioester hydrolase
VTGPAVSPPFELSVEVAPGDIDFNGHVSNIAYVRWVQDVAVAHWSALAPAEAQAAIAWVVLRHEIDYKAAAVLGDGVALRTWVGAASGLTFERHTEILRAADRRVLVRARTLWCPISVRTGRPRRVTDELRALFSV